MSGTDRYPPGHPAARNYPAPPATPTPQGSPNPPTAQPVSPEAPIASPVASAVPTAQPVPAAYPSMPATPAPTAQPVVPSAYAAPTTPAPPAQPVMPAQEEPVLPTPAQTTPAAYPTVPTPSAVPTRQPANQPIPIQPGQPQSQRPQQPRPTNRPVPVAVANTTAVREDAEEGEEDDLEGKPPKALLAAPPWLVSLIFHIALLITLALIFFTPLTEPMVEILVMPAEEIGEQLEDDSIDFSNNEEMVFDEAVITPVDLLPVEDPLAAPPEVDIVLDATSSTSELTAPTIGMALTGREKGMKSTLLAAYGGNATTEASVEAGLAWLKKNQKRDGSWSLIGPFKDGAPSENKVAATAMALLAFQGAGHTHRTGDHQEIVTKGWQWLLKQQSNEGSFIPRGVSDHHNLYTHAQATIALCELYGMTKDEKYKAAAQKAVKFSVDAQGDAGGWRYHPGNDGDTSVTGWYVMALQSALMAGLEVPSPTLQKIHNFLDQVAVDGGRRYAYRPGSHVNDALSAEGLLCRQYLGWKQDDVRLKEGLDMVVAKPIDYNDQNVYYWYYATQAAHHMEGEHWNKWNRVMREKVPANQTKTGPEAGSWSPGGDEWGVRGGGRLYTTCLSIYMLEVYYRHLPIYNEVYKYKLQQF